MYYDGFNVDLTTSTMNNHVDCFCVWQDPREGKNRYIVERNRNVEASRSIRALIAPIFQFWANVEWKFGTVTVEVG